MKKHLLLATGLLLAVAMGSCTKKTDFEGSWVLSAPEDMTGRIEGAATATSMLTITFVDDANENGGSVVLGSIFNITQAVSPEGVSIDAPYETSVAAAASVPGKWTYRDGHDDDLVLSFDVDSLQVHIDNNGVTFSQNLLTGAQQPQIDSLTTATAQAWKARLTDAIRRDLSRFTQIDDIKVHAKGSVMTFETENPEQEFTFRRAE